MDDQDLTIVPPHQTQFYVTELVERFNTARAAEIVHPLLLIGIFVLTSRPSTRSTMATDASREFSQAPPR